MRSLYAQAYKKNFASTIFFYNRRMKKLWMLGLSALLVSGCASVTQYRPAPDEDESGYSETRIQDDMFSIQFLGEDRSNFQRVADYALLRSAEVVLGAGYPYFRILSGEYNAKTVSETYMGPVGYWGNYGWGGGYYADWTGRISRSPITYLLVQGYKNKPEGPGIFDAAQVQKNLRGKYGLAGSGSTKGNKG